MSVEDNCVIGANSVVTKDVPNDVVVAGSPARVICSIKKHYEYRNIRIVKERKEFVKSWLEGEVEITENFFWEFFPLFKDRAEKLAILQKKLFEDGIHDYCNSKSI